MSTAVSVSLPLLAALTVLYACGIYLLLEKSITRVIIGILLVGNATNLLLLVLAGPPGDAPIVGDGRVSSDPLPQALILTAIVITFAVSAFLMALVYRSWSLAQQDQLEPDAEDVALATRHAPEPEDAEVDEDSEFSHEHGPRDGAEGPA